MIAKRFQTASAAASDEPRARAHALWQQGEEQAARDVLAHSIASGAGDCLAYNDLAVLLFLRADYSGAEHWFAEALRLDAAFPPALRGCGEALLRLQRYAEAIDLLERYRRSDAASFGAALSLVECYFESGHLQSAAKLAEASLDGNPDSVRLLLLLARIYQRQRLPGKLLTTIKAAVALNPEDPDLRAQLALAHWEFGSTEEAFGQLKEVPRRAQVRPDLQFNLSWLSLHDPRQTARSLREAHRRAVIGSVPIAFFPPLPVMRPLNHRPLRIGYVSGEFIGGPAFCFLASWLKHVDRSQFQSTFYSTRWARGPKPSAFRGMADRWRDAGDLSNDDLEHHIRRDQIDILVDLSGHYDGNRLALFARRAAPVQVTFPNYPGTSGVPQIDYILTDVWTTPPGCETDYVERPYRLPSGYLAYEPPIDPPAVPQLPQIVNGFVTFGLFQRPGKYHARFWDVVGEVMREQPDARLLVHFASAELDEPDSPQRSFLAQLLEQRGIGGARVRFAGERDEREHMRLVAEADVALDSFPYNGQTTTCDCLWMGVPVVTMRGRTHVSRVGTSLLYRMKMEELVTDSEEGYIRTAVSLSSDVARLSGLRLRLRQEVQKRLGNGALLAREIGDAYRWMWDRAARLAVP